MTTQSPQLTQTLANQTEALTKLIGLIGNATGAEDKTMTWADAGDRTEAIKHLARGAYHLGAIDEATFHSLTGHVEEL